MSESIAEMILPDTYIEVRAEGLIAVGSIATGNIGIVGTAAHGPLGEMRQVGGIVEAIDLYGPEDLISTLPPGATPLSLTRALKQVFAGGGSNVFAVRIAAGDPVAAILTVPVSAAAGANTAFVLTANEGGSWGNDIQVVLVDNGAAVTPRQRVSVTYRNQREVFEGANVGQLRTALAGSQLVTVGDGGASAAGATAIADAFTGNLANGDSLPQVNSTHVTDGLALLEEQPVNIVLVAGLGASVAAAPLLAHVDRTQDDSHERIAIVGASATDSATVINDAGGIADGRMVLVAPGLKVAEPGRDQLVSLNPSYTAALIAGRLAAIAPQVSLTNQTLPITDLDGPYTTTVHRTLLQNRVMAVRRRFGFQIVRGISTDPGAFSQVSVRRIVDYAKAGVRLGSNPYIGKLNNVRVRAALKATLDGFLSQMVVDEMLTAYELQVSATRAQEIRGIASVVMTLQPTFSIDFIRVTMNLQ